VPSKQGKRRTISDHSIAANAIGNCSPAHISTRASPSLQRLTVTIRKSNHSTNESEKPGSMSHQFCDGTVGLAKYRKECATQCQMFIDANVPASIRSRRSKEQYFDSPDRTRLIAALDSSG
jgi:hypothetical protein